MPHAEEIPEAVAVIVPADNTALFSHDDVKRKIGSEREMWKSYSATFQAMRSNHPGGAPPMTERYRNVFEQIEHGKHRLIPSGLELVTETIRRS